MVDGDTTQNSEDIYGYHITSILTGDHITMEDGYGIPIMVMSGILMILGDGLHITTEDGTGVYSTAGIGYQVITGPLPGYTGTGMIITMDGVH